MRASPSPSSGSGASRRQGKADKCRYQVTVGLPIISYIMQPIVGGMHVNLSPWGGIDFNLRNSFSRHSRENLMSTTLHPGMLCDRDN